MSSSVIRSASYASIIAEYMSPQLRSHPAFRAIAAASAGVSTHLCPVIISFSAPQSDVIYPSNPHLPRSISESNCRLAQHGSPFSLLYAPIIPATPLSTVFSNAGRYVSQRSCLLTTALKPCRSPSGPECAAKCFAQAAAFRNSPSPCMPFIYATARADVRNGSSPSVSCPLPHLGSRNMFMFGAQNVNPLYIS